MINLTYNNLVVNEKQETSHKQTAIMTPAPEEYQNNPEELSVHEEKKRMYKMIRGNSIDFKNKFMN